MNGEPSTGGRAILHTDELTYSVAAPDDHPLMRGMVLDAYLRISNALVAGLGELGITAQEAPGSSRAGPDCRDVHNLDREEGILGAAEPLVGEEAGRAEGNHEEQNQCGMADRPA